MIVPPFLLLAAIGLWVVARELSGLGDTLFSVMLFGGAVVCTAWAVLSVYWLVQRGQQQDDG